jgi:hypothetical protein
VAEAAGVRAGKQARALADELLGTGPAALAATLVTRQIIGLAFEAGLRPCVAPPGPRAGSYRVIVDSGGRADCLFGGIDIGARAGRILRAYFTQGDGGAERRYDQVAEIRSVIRSWAAARQAAGQGRPAPGRPAVSARQPARAPGSLPLIPAPGVSSA